MAAVVNATGPNLDAGHNSLDRGSGAGLYRPGYEHDACGVAFVADLHGRPSHAMVEMGLASLCHLEHRGAKGADPETGDGAGILVQIPDRFLRAAYGLELPAPGAYATGIAFLPIDRDGADEVCRRFEDLAGQEGLSVLAWRDVPVEAGLPGAAAQAVMPSFRQVVVTGDAGQSGMALERLAFVLRKRAEHEIPGIYFPSLSARTLVYKGMLTAPQLPGFFHDFSDPLFESGLVLAHARFSTNTFPSWPLAHPYRYVAHNGEFNTVQGNRNWMRTREAMLESRLVPGDISRIFPVVTPGGSDSMSFDEVLELLYLGGRSLPHAVLMMIPEAWENKLDLPPERRAFYEFHSCLMEPWDGPAAVAFTDGTLIGAQLDRNGFRPLRYWVTDDDLVILASEVGVLDVPASKIVLRGRIQPGRMFLVDTVAGRIVDDDEVKDALAAEHPYGAWLAAGLIDLEDLPMRRALTPQYSRLVSFQRQFGYTEEEIRLVLAPMVKDGSEPLSSMGDDTPLAVLSRRPRLLYDYFRQLFAQVTNPPLDAIREELITSLSSSIGPEGNLLEPGPRSCHQIILPGPVLTNDELATLVYMDDDGLVPGWHSFAIDGLFAAQGPAGPGERLRAALDQVCAEVEEAVLGGASVIVLSDRHANADFVPIPALLLVSAVHHFLVDKKLRTRVGLIVETGEARAVHHMACLIGYGAAAINPYLAFDTVVDQVRRGAITDMSPRKALNNYVKAASKGVLKTMSKMGISTVASYTGAQVFEGVGLASDIVEKYFKGTPTQIEGIGLEEIAGEALARHRAAWPDRPAELAHRDLEPGGEWQWRREGEYHLFNPDTVFKLQHATRAKSYKIFKKYSQAVDDQSRHLATLRGLLRLRPAEETGRRPVPLDEVEPVPAIVKRFNTGAMSYGAISQEAHETLAIAMNRLGARSNSGEGGEDPGRNVPDPNGDSRRSAIRQVAAGRFGVTSEYLVHADDIQIKMAQGAKPGEGGQLPGKKVYPWIAKTRYSTPGVGLISPPPHHDIYSIEDLAQLIFDLKNANPRARINVKLVAETGVGTVAAGVAKAHADVVLISGHDGGTGASPMSSTKHAGGPWELGLAETQQTLLRNGLRDRVVVQADGSMKTGRDVIIAALLGAEEYGFSTAPLVVEGCIMMRVCHLDTCPVGVATQNPELRKRFTGTPDLVVSFFEYVAEEVREWLSELGFRSLEEAIGRSDVLEVGTPPGHLKAATLDLSALLLPPPEGVPLHATRQQDHQLDQTLDARLIEACRPALEEGAEVRGSWLIANSNRAVGTMLGSEITRRYGGSGLPPGTIDLELTGSAGQSFGAFLPSGVTLRLFGDANDYLGKGLSGGRIIVRPTFEVPAGFAAEANIIAGNVIGYGATSGEIFIRGVVGERFCVRNSGALAVVEGVGDHGCEYMTGGRVVVLGPTGRNFAAGMSGGFAYVYDPNSRLPGRLNHEMVELEVLGDDDTEWLAAVLLRYAGETASELAERLLDNVAVHASSFVKVVPTDYRRALDAARMSEGEPEAVAAIMMAAAHG
ncbi:MAG TPA: glutamate synthase large subunit [Acidimicrobiales bacterium]|nr:glutamate synthase large subunit [Acidimicrobiales bacterium]